MSVQQASAILERNGSKLIESESVAAVLEVRKAIMNDASMTKDLEEQIDNVTIAEQIVRRPSSTSVEDENDRLHSMQKKMFNVSPVATTSPRIEPITEKVVPFSSKFPRLIHRRETADNPRNSGVAHPTRYKSLLGDSDSQRRMKGSLTSSSDEDTAGKLEPVDPVSFSSSGAAVLEISTQTPEEMNSSNEEHTDTEREDGDRNEIVQEVNGETREPSSESSEDSSSETEEWDSEADTHTSPSDEEAPSVKPRTSYYQVIDGKAAPSNRPVPKNGNPRSLKGQFMATSLPWMRRPTFTSMQFPSTVTSSSHPRREMPLPSSRSFPQDFCHMVSNPFFSISLHDAYQQACAFKEWYETHFPDQIHLNGPTESHESMPVNSHFKATSSASKHPPPGVLDYSTHNTKRLSK